MRGIFLFLITASIACACYADFISSKTSQIFHTRGCRYASSLREIDTEDGPANAFVYETYPEAIEAELRPCKVCDPQPGSEPDPDPEPEPDPNTIIPLPPEPSIIIPIEGVILAMDWL